MDNSFYKGRTIRKVMGGGGGEGNFRAAGIFFGYQIPCMHFFWAIAWIFFRVNWLARIFFHLIFPCSNFFLYFVRPPPHKFSNGPSLINALCRQLSPCGHPAIMNTSIVRTAAKSQAKINHRCLIEITSRYHWLSLMRTLTQGSDSVGYKGSWSFIYPAHVKYDVWIKCLT